jgi:predicted nuclease of predicted toxin-antitoxin system
MDILADENVRRDLVEALRAQGHDVQWIAETHPAKPDEDVFQVALSTNRVLLTADLDFSDLVYRQRRTGLRGLIQLRIDDSLRDEFVKSVLEAWGLVESWEGLTTVLEAGRVRQRPLP